VSSLSLPEHPRLSPDVVAVLNTSPDTVELLRIALQHSGFTVVSGYIHDVRDGRLDLEAFVRQHEPMVVVWDISPPYDVQWKFFEHMRLRPACSQCRFVITTTNVTQLRKVAGPGQELHEIIGKPYDLEDIVAAVRNAMID
jgi:DNA-binding response OmpR family regulator